MGGDPLKLQKGHEGGRDKGALPSRTPFPGVEEMEETLHTPSTSGRVNVFFFFVLHAAFKSLHIFT